MMTMMMMNATGQNFTGHITVLFGVVLCVGVASVSVLQ